MSRATQPEIFGRFSALADPARGRVLVAVERRELAVSELCEVLGMPQSTVSRHLKTLADEGWLASRPEGTSRFYRFDPDRLEAADRRLWLLLRDAIAGTPEAARDRARATEVVERRRSRSQSFFDGAAEQWDRLRDEAFGDGFFLHALPAMLDESWEVADLGCGTGRVAEALAPFVRRVIAVDGSDAMLAAARRRLTGFAGVDLRAGGLEALPIEDAAVDAATLVLVLHHVPEPSRVLDEAARVLRAGGKLLIVDMPPHDRQEYVERMGHVWMGFAEDAIAGMLGAAGFERPRIRRLPVDPRAKGPGLFVAAARRSTARSRSSGGAARAARGGAR